MNYRKFNRLYIQDVITVGARIEQKAEHKHYIHKVLRLDTSDNIRIFNQNDGEFLCNIYIEGKNLYLDVMQKLKNSDNTNDIISIAPAVIKNDRLLFLIEKAVELGVTSIEPIFCEFSQGRNLNHEKITKYIIEGAEQSERLKLPVLENPQLLKNFLDKYQNKKIFFVFSEREQNVSIIDIMGVDLSSVILLTGPEGGFSDTEFGLFDAHNKLYSNVYYISLGNNILRSETAMIAAICQLQTIKLVNSRIV